MIKYLKKLGIKATNELVKSIISSKFEGNVEVSLEAINKEEFVYKVMIDGYREYAFISDYGFNADFMPCFVQDYQDKFRNVLYNVFGEEYLQDYKNLVRQQYIDKLNERLKEVDKEIEDIIDYDENNEIDFRQIKKLMKDFCNNADDDKNYQA